MPAAPPPLPGSHFVPRRRRWAALLAVAVTVSASLVLLSAAPAQAHAELVSSTPAAGERLASAPSGLLLTFSDPINPKLITVILAVGDQSPSRLAVTAAGPAVTATVPPPSATPDPPTAEAAPQNWTVTYQVVSADGHPISGKLAFTVDAPPATPPPAPPTTPPATSPSSSTGSATAPVTATATDPAAGSSPSAPALAAAQTQPHNEDDVKPLIALIIGAALVVAIGWIALFRRRRSRTTDAG